VAPWHQVSADGLSASYAQHMYASSVAVGGGWVFIAWLTADYHVKVARYDEATMEPGGTIDFGYG